MKCGCHPNCGIGTALMVNKKTKKWCRSREFLDVERLLDDVADDHRHGAQRPTLTKLQIGAGLLRNYRPSKAPEGFALDAPAEAVRQADGGALGGRLNDDTEGDRKSDEWRVLFVAGMWFQDLFNYDFRRTEMCIIPYGTQMGEISFCAYNTGVGWRQIVEKMHKNATVAEWYKTHGRHAVYANPKKAVPLPDAVPVALKIPRDGRLVDYVPQPKAAALDSTELVTS